VLNLAEFASIRLMADKIRVESIDRDGPTVVLKFRPDARLDPAWLFKIIEARGDVVLLPPATLKLDLKRPVSTPPAAASANPVPKPVPAAVRPRRGKGADPVAQGSWWAARAKTGDVSAGFSREQILRPAQEDPRAEDGLFARLGGLLRQLSSDGEIG
jgi:hypothetical protein